MYITNNLNYQRYEVNCIPKGDCVIFISYSGETKTLINMAKHVKRKIFLFKFNFFWRKYVKSNE